MCFRAKHRKETRQEEQRGDWYFERKQKKQLEEEEKRRKGEGSEKRDEKPGEKRKGEEKRGEKVRKKRKSGKKEMKFEEREFHAERHYREGWQRKPEKESKFSGNDDFHVDFDYKFNHH